MTAGFFEGPRVRRVSLLARGAVGLAAAKMLAADRSVRVVSYQAGELSPALRALFPKAKRIVDPASDLYTEHCRKDADCILSAHCNVVLPPKTLEAVAHPLNLHPGYLPYGRGYWPTYWAIADESPAGATLHRMAALVDRGLIVAQKRVPILPIDTGEVLTRRVAEGEIALLRAIWPRVRSGRYPAFKARGAGTYHDRADGLNARRLSGGETMSARRLVNLIRAFTDARFDGASVRLDGREVFLRLALHEAARKGRKR
ncbi:MAG: formyltransferase family protein [Elusimicrobiota bacterium]